MRRPKNLLPARGLRGRPLALRCAAVLAAGLGLAVAGAGLAAATGPQPIAPSELSKATTAARSSTATTLLTKAASTA
ncbi:hypothetical protein, partial [Kribbella sp.]|uniref:hypothetical protein n=1 Tax=Kribbella sp. TaxID=1871183 RepID=UPI002D248C81